MGCMNNIPNIKVSKVVRGINPNQDVIVTNLYSTMSQKDKKEPDLQDYMYTNINQFSIDLKVYYKNQKPPKDTEASYIDPLFPPNDNSIFGFNKRGEFVDPIETRRIESSKYFQVKSGQAVWKRPNEIFHDQPYSVFEGKVESSDSIQGGVGDCYFLSAISAIAQFPQMICQIFKTNQVMENGCYQIAMRLNGEWKIVVVDDYFPCSKVTSLPIFSKPNGNEIWSMLLEKVWAKVNGGYINIDAGFTIEVLSALTPFPIEVISHQEYRPDELWNKLKTSNQNEYILTCITKCDENIESHGLIAGHSCTLVRALQRTIKGKEVKLIKIRNPWGYKEWSGKYSDNSPEWDDESLKTICDMKAKEDGIFWMEFDDYVKFFEETEICKANKCLAVKNIKISKERAVFPNVFGLILDQKTNVEMNILRKSYRYNRKILQSEEIITNIILIKIKRKSKAIKLIKTNSVSGKRCGISLELIKGEYLIYCYVDYTHGHFDKIRKYTFDIACDQYFNLYDNGVDKKFYLLKQIIETKVEERLIANKSSNHIRIECSSGFEDTTFGFLFVKNICPKAHRILLIPKLENLYLMDSKYQQKNKLNNNQNTYWNNSNNNSNDSDNNTDKNNNEIELVLTQDTAFVLLGNTIDFYKDTEMTFEYEKYHSKDTGKNQRLMVAPNSNKIYNFFQGPKLNNVFRNYTFIYNKIKFDSSDISKQIDHKKLAMKTMQERYPNEMKELLKLPPLKDNEDVIFRDRYYIGNDYYFGEQHYVSMVRHGRGIYYWSRDKLKFIGYSIRGQFQGYGKYYYANNEIHEGMFVNGSLVGKGKIYKPNGKVEEVEFPIN